MCPATTKNIKVIMSDNNSKIYVCEWEKQSDTEDYSLKVTSHESTETALQQAQSSTANQHCVSTVNPVEDGEERK
jgi:hypothetical protein